jgi:hypothetical protein
MASPIHLIVTGGGLSLDGKRWIETDPKSLDPNTEVMRF